MKPRTLLQGLAGLAAWGCLSGLALVRLWAVLYGRVPGPAILAAAAALAAEFGRSMQTALELLNPMMALEAIEAMRAGLENAGGYTGGELLRLTAEACGTWYLLARNLQYDVPGGDTLRERFARRADLCASADDVWCCLRGMLSEAMQVLSEQKRQADTRPIRTAKQYIQEHYADPLTLEWVSNIVGFSGSYFSSLFKKETVRTFWNICRRCA